MAQIISLLTRRDRAFLTVQRRKAFEDYKKAKVYFLAMKIKHLTLSNCDSETSGH